jgi:hypothetical protein
MTEQQENLSKKEESTVSEYFWRYPLYWIERFVVFEMKFWTFLSFLICVFILFSDADIACQNVQKFAQQSDFQLAKPQIISQQILFENKNQIELILDYQNAEIRYTLDGNEPNEKSFLYVDPITIRKSTYLRAIALHPNCRTSMISEAKFLRVNKSSLPKRIVIDRKPNENYPGSGPESLMDFRKGTTNFRTNHWMGFNGGRVNIILEYDKKQTIKKVVASMLSDPGAWIFLPSEIQVLTSKKGKKYRKVGNTRLSQPTPEMHSGLQFITVNCENKKARFIQIQIDGVPAIPEWHQGKGTPAWLFIDEIIVN